MALGDYDNNKKEIKKPTVYSPYAGFNTFSTVDPSRIAYSFWNRMLKITVTPMTGKNADGSANWDTNNAMAAYFTHTKAHIMANEIRNFLKDPDMYTSSGVISNETLVTISNGAEFGVQGVFLVLRKIDKETGKTLSSYSYQFNTDFHSAVRNYDEKTAQFGTEFDEYSMLEVHQLLMVLDSYVESMTYAQAYAVVDSIDYNHRQIMDLLNACAQSLGVSKASVSGSRSSGSSIFNQRNNRSMATKSNGSTQHVSADDIEEDLFG